MKITNVAQDSKGVVAFIKTGGSKTRRVCVLYQSDGSFMISPAQIFGMATGREISGRLMTELSGDCMKVQSGFMTTVNGHTRRTPVGIWVGGEGVIDKITAGFTEQEMRRVNRLRNAAKKLFPQVAPHFKKEVAKETRLESAAPPASKKAEGSVMVDVPYSKLKKVADILGRKIHISVG